MIVLLYPFPAGIPPPRKDRSKTPLHLAATRGSTSLVSLLDPPPDDVLAIDADGCTPLHPAAASCEHDVSKSLAFRANERVSVEGDKYSCCCCFFYCCGEFFLTVGRLALISNIGRVKDAMVGFHTSLYTVSF